MACFKVHGIDVQRREFACLRLHGQARSCFKIGPHQTCMSEEKLPRQSTTAQWQDRKITGSQTVEHRVTHVVT